MSSSDWLSYDGTRGEARRYPYHHHIIYTLLFHTSHNCITSSSHHYHYDHDHDLTFPDVGRCPSYLPLFLASSCITLKRFTPELLARFSYPTRVFFRDSFCSWVNFLGFRVFPLLFFCFCVSLACILASLSLLPSQRRSQRTTMAVPRPHPTGALLPRRLCRGGTLSNFNLGFWVS